MSLLSRVRAYQALQAGEEPEPEAMLNAQSEGLGLLARIEANDFEPEPEPERDDVPAWVLRAQRCTLSTRWGAMPTGGPSRA